MRSYLKTYLPVIAELSVAALLALSLCAVLLIAASWE
jgi:hypothetical protein